MSKTATVRNTQDVDILLRRSDLLDVGLMDSGSLARFPPELAARLQMLLDAPDG